MSTTTDISPRDIRTRLVDSETNERWLSTAGDATSTPAGRAWITRSKADYRRRTGRTLVVEIYRHA